MFRKASGIVTLAGLIAVAIAVVAMLPRREASLFASKFSEEKSPVRVLVLTGVSNPAHDWKSSTAELCKLLGDKRLFAVDVCDDPNHRLLATEALDDYHVVVLNFNRQSRWAPDVEAGFCRHLEQGKGVVVVHAANNSFRDWPEYERIIGGGWHSASFHPNYGPFIVHAEKPDHPILDGVERFEVVDEMYCNLRIHPEQTEVLAYAMGPDTRRGVSLKKQPVVWTTNYSGGAVFHLTLGHDAAAMRNRHFASLFRRGTLWAAKALGSGRASDPVVASSDAF